MRKPKIILITSVLAIISSLAFSQPNERGIRNRNEVSPLRISQVLNLSEEQSKVFNEFKYQNDLEVINIRTEIKKNHVELKKMLADNNIDGDRILSLTDNNSQLQSQLERSKTKMWLDVYNILNDEQKGKWTKFLNHFIQDGNLKGKIGKREMLGKVKRNRNWDQ